MHKLIPVEEAKLLFHEAKDWSVWRWLTEKKRCRSAADRAWEALGESEKQAKSSWSEDLVKAYRAVEAEEKGDNRANGVDPALKTIATRIREADNEAYNAHMDAEDQFDEAEKRLSAAMARQAAQRAIEAWELTEKAIRKAEFAGRKP
jgi:hypothetical protein